MFASKSPRDLNHDPAPWRSNGGLRTNERNPFHAGVIFRHDPRPEFDHVQHNPVNPILVSLRGRLKFQNDVHHPSAAPRIAQTMLAVLDRRYPWLEPATDDELAHARAVLTRLANLAEKEQA